MSVAGAVVEIRPDVQKFARELRAGVKRAADDAEKVLATGIADGADEGARKGSGKVRDTFVKSGKQTGEQTGKAIGAGIEQGTNASIERMKSVGNKLSMAVTAPLLLVGKRSIDIATNFQDAADANAVFFGEQSAQILEFSKQAAESYNLSRLSTVEAANAMAPLINSFTAADERGTRTIDTIKRMGDMASFFGGRVDEAQVAVASFLSGSSVEPIRRYGVFASEAAVQVKALQLGLVGGANQAKAQIDSLVKAQSTYTEVVKKYGSASMEASDAALGVTAAEEAVKTALGGKLPELTEAMKIQSRYALLMDATAVAEGNAADTYDSAANSQKRAREQMEDAALVAGEKLLPLMTRVYGIVGDVATAFSSMPGAAQTGVIALMGVAAVAGPLLRVVAAVRSISAANRIAAISANNLAAAQGRAAAAGSLTKGAGMLGRLGTIGTVATAGIAAYQGTRWVDSKIGLSNALADGLINAFGTGAGVALGDLIPGLATGGTVLRGGPVVVGEQGPELLNLPAGAVVTPNRELTGNGQGVEALAASVASLAAAVASQVPVQVSVVGRAADDPKALAKEINKLSAEQAHRRLRTNR